MRFVAPKSMLIFFPFLFPFQCLPRDALDATAQRLIEIANGDGRKGHVAGEHLLGAGRDDDGRGVPLDVNVRDEEPRQYDDQNKRNAKEDTVQEKRNEQIKGYSICTHTNIPLWNGDALLGNVLESMQRAVLQKVFDALLGRLATAERHLFVAGVLLTAMSIAVYRSMLLLPVRRLFARFAWPISMGFHVATGQTGATRRCHLYRTLPVAAHQNRVENPKSY